MASTTPRTSPGSATGWAGDGGTGGPGRFGSGPLIPDLGAKSEIVYRAGLLLVFVPFAVLSMREPIKLDYLWATLCLVAAVYFVFRAQP